MSLISALSYINICLDPVGMTFTDFAVVQKMTVVYVELPLIVSESCFEGSCYGFGKKNNNNK